METERRKDSKPDGAQLGLHIPMRKQSSGDLQSRLKTRKLLGVGECEDGSVPISKISQILGSDDNFLTTFPVGLRLWQVTTSVVYSVVAVLAIFFPSALFDVLFNVDAGREAVLPIRLFGAAVTCLAVLFWSSARSMSRAVIQWTLLAETFYLAMLSIILSYSLWSESLFSFPTFLVVALLLMSFLISSYFYSVMTGRYRTLMRTRQNMQQCVDPKTD